MKCPKCTNGMIAVKLDDVTVERCESCKGLWFDALEERAVRDADAAAKLDIGAETVGAQWDGTGKIRCPRCTSPMVRMVDREQTHIWFEMCSTCHGRFYDAGELRDLKERSLGEMLRRPRKGERPLD